jgi:hypothetical protein
MLKDIVKRYAQNMMNHDSMYLVEYRVNMGSCVIKNNSFCIENPYKINFIEDSQYKILTHRRMVKMSREKIMASQ